MALFWWPFQIFFLKKNMSDFLAHKIKIFTDINGSYNVRNSERLSIKRANLRTRSFVNRIQLSNGKTRARFRTRCHKSTFNWTLCIKQRDIRDLTCSKESDSGYVRRKNNTAERFTHFAKIVSVTRLRYRNASAMFIAIIPSGACSWIGTFPRACVEKRVAKQTRPAFATRATVPVHQSFVRRNRWL